MIVLDTSFLVAWANESDAHHERALAAVDRIANGELGRLLLPEYVVVETATVLAARKDLPSSARFIEALLDAREIEYVPCGPAFLDAFRLFRSQKRFALNFVDAAIMAVANSRGATHIATYDEALAKAAGLLRLPA